MDDWRGERYEILRLRDRLALGVTPKQRDALYAELLRRAVAHGVRKAWEKVETLLGEFDDTEALEVLFEYCQAQLAKQIERGEVDV